MFQFSDIAAYHAQLVENKVSCEEVVKLYLSRIEGNTHLNAFVEIYADEAVTTAISLDLKRNSGEPLKKLHGVIIAIKDVICYKGHKISAGSKMLQNFTSLYTATALQFLIDEDAIIIGNCNCDEFAMGSSNEYSFYGPVKNAADITKVPGGSSGGSAVAVQAQLCMLSLGSDTGGSVRQPASHCGVVGFKPGYGSISRYGLIAYASSFDQIGIFGTTIQDINILWQIMHRADVLDSTMGTAAVQPVTNKNSICVFPEIMNHPALDPCIAQSMKDQILELKKSGYHINEVSFPLLDYVVPAYYILTTAEASSNLSRYDGVRYGHRSQTISDDINVFYKLNRSEGFGIEVKRRIMMGNYVLSSGYYDAYYNKAQKFRQTLTEFFERIFENNQAILLPVSTTTASPLGSKGKDNTSVYLADIYTVMANLTGCTAISLPLFSHSNNMPFGLQLMAKKDNELSLLALSQSILKETGKS